MRHRRAAITVNRPVDEIERLWNSSERAIDGTATFKTAPGERGTEIHVELRHDPPGGKVGEIVQKVAGSDPLAKAKDELRRFKQQVETGEVPRSDGSPAGERLESKLKQRPAQPLSAEELEEVGAR